ncbi:MAG: 4-hydroxy-3-methylbut-2-enyl diphosphate reductase [bacterium]|nr:4-hydroxy-3-methylbut-2-enyl diphosphate reductase [bacterium]
MEIITGKYAGFCPGVKRAWQLVEKTVAANHGTIFILGELIHNKQAIEKLKEMGVCTIENLEEIKGKEGTVIIRAHGEPPSTFLKLSKMKKIKVVDATCHSVVHVQKLAKKLESEGYQVLVCGEKDHPEALATVGYTKKGQIVCSCEDVRTTSSNKKIGVISQTTFSSRVFDEICQLLKNKVRAFKSLGTICSFVQTAQREARKIAGEVDTVLVVGGKQSSNTKRLAEVAGAITRTHHIETDSEIQKDWFERAQKVGLLAGASTPAWIIEKVKKRLIGVNDYLRA